MQQAISYVVSRLANVADVHPSNVESSLLQRTVRFRDFALRKETLNKMLPFPILSGHISDLLVEIPWPVPNKPLIINLHGTTITLDFLHQNTGMVELSMGEIQDGITDESILGVPTTSTAGDETLMEEQEELPAMSPLRSDVELEKIWVSPEVDDDDDYMSCRSDTDTSSSSFDSAYDSLPPLVEEERWGLFSFLRSAASQSVSWLVDRPIHIHVADVKLIIPCDSSNETRFDIEANEVFLQAEPSQAVSTERLKVVTITLTGITVDACTPKGRTRVIHVENFTIRFTSVYNTSGILCRKNTAIVLEGLTSLFSDENALQSLTQCMVSHRIMTQIPEYCRPFSELRRQRLWWAYAKNCVLAQVREKRKRYNLNPAHLNFYAEARNAYLKLLDYCHRTGDVAENRNSLAEVESDLHYRDVVMFLRRKAHERYSAASSRGECRVDEAPRESDDGSTGTVVSSFHVDVRAVCVYLPGKTTMGISDIAFVSRVDEVNFSIRSISININGVAQTFYGAEEGGAILSFQRTEKKDIIFVKVQLGELRFTADFRYILDIIKPFIIATSESLSVLPEQGSALWLSPQSESPTPYTRRVQTTTFVFPLIQIQIDHLVFLCKKFSLTAVGEISGRKRIGFLLEEVSLCFGTNDLVLSPVKVEMTDSDDIMVSVIAINVSNEFLNYLHDIWNSLLDTVSASRSSNKSGRNVTATREKKQASATLIDIWSVIWMKDEYSIFPNSQKVLFLGIQCNCHFIKLKLHLGHLNVHQGSLVNACDAVCLGCSSFMLLIDYFDDAPLCVDLSSGFVCVTSTNKNGDFCLVVTLDMAQFFWKVISPLNLLGVYCVKMALCGDLSYCSADKARLFETIEAAPLRGLYRRYSSATPTTTRPFLASSLQVSVTFSSVWVHRLSHVDFEKLRKLMNEYISLFIDRVVSVEAYRLFFSSFSDIAVLLHGSSCPVFFDEANALMCRISMPAVENSVDRSLLKFGELLPELRNVSLLTMINACDVLSVALNMPLVRVELFHPHFPSISAYTEIHSLSGVMPIPSQDFWDPVVCTVDSNPLELTCRYFDLDCGPIAKLEVGGVRYTRGNTPLNGDASTVVSDSEMGSVEASSTVGEDISHLEVKNWSLGGNLSPGATILNDLFGLWGELRHMTNCFLAKHIITCNFVRGGEYDLDKTGQWFFNCPGEVIIVEDCTFLFRGTGVQMVVCSRSYVYFRRCRFVSSIRDVVRVADDNAAFVCEDCEECAVSVEAIPHDTQRAFEKKYSEKYCVMINRGRVNLNMLADCRVVVHIPEVDVHVGTTSRKISSHFRAHRCRWEYTEDNVPHSLVSRLDIDVDSSFRRRDCRARLSASISVGGVSIPLAMFKTVHGVVLEWNSGSSGLATTTRTYVLPRERKELPVAKWICLLTTSAIPFDFCLLSGVPYAKLIVPTISICSKRLATEDTFVEFQIGAQDFVIWEFSSQSFVPLLRKPLTFVVVLRTTDFCTATCDVSISPLDLSLSSEQVRCTLSLLKFIQSDGKHEGGEVSRWCSMYMDNQVGAPLMLHSATEKFVVTRHLALERKRLLFPHCLVEVGGRKVDHFEKADLALPDESSSCVLQTVDVAVLDDGLRVYMTTHVQAGSLVQHVTLRTSFHILNGLPCAVRLCSPNNADAAVVVAVVIQPKEMSCIPLCYLDSTEVAMSLISLNEEATSTEELLSEKSPRGLFEVAVSRGVESIGRLKAFTFAGHTVHVDMTYRLQGTCLTMCLAPAMPSIHNGTYFPMKVSTLLDGCMTEETIVRPGDTLVALKYDPFGKPLRYLFGCVVYGKTYMADESVSLDAIPPLVGESIVMKHEQFPRRHFFELNIERQPISSSFPSVGVLYSVVPRHLFGLLNNSYRDVEITSESGDSVGTLGGEVLSCASRRNFAYIPFHTPLVLHAEKAISTSFEVSKSFEERMLVCDISDNSEMVGASHCFLLRTLKSNDVSPMELIPALFLVNKDPTRSLLVKHVVRQKEGTDGSEWVHTVLVPASGVQSHTIVARYGYTNFFSFEWEGNTNETDYSQSIEAMLSSKTDWTGFVRCGNTHHTVKILKESLVSAAVVAISGPHLPYLTLVNLTPRTYDLVQPMSVVLCTPPSVNNEEVFLDGSEAKTRIQLSHNMRATIAEDVCVFVRTRRDSVTVVLSLIPVNRGILLSGDDTYEDASSKGCPMLRVDVKSSSVLLTVWDAGDYPVHLGMEGTEFWFMYQSPKMTAQCTLSDAYVQSSYKGDKTHVVRPFCFDMTIRDVGMNWDSVSVPSTQINLTQLELEVSDVFIYQLQQLSIHCLPQPFLPVENTSSVSFARTKQLQLVKNRKIKLSSVIICEVSILVTYDRSVRPPQDVLFHGSSIGSVIPSLHRATLRFPTLQLRDISGDSVMEVVDVVRGVLFLEFLKQIPKLLTSVVWFPSLSHFSGVLSRVGSFIFGSGSSSSELPGTTLI